MQFIFLIGVEGAGHGLMRSILQPFLNLPTTIDQGIWHAPLVELWNLHNLDGKMYNLPYNNYITTALTKDKTKYSHAFESASFPFGQPRDPLRHPNINHIRDLIKKIDGIDFVPIVIYRNFLNCVHSGVRRGFTDNITLQAKIIESNLFYIYKQIKHIPYYSINFETMLNYSKAYINNLARIMRMHPDIIERGLNSIVDAQYAPKHYEHILKNVVCKSSIAGIYSRFAQQDLEGVNV